MPVWLTPVQFPQLEPKGITSPFKLRGACVAASGVPISGLKLPFPSIRWRVSPAGRMRSCVGTVLRGRAVHRMLYPHTLISAKNRPFMRPVPNLHFNLTPVSDQKELKRPPAR